MKFLIDNNISPKISVLLNKSGHDSIHIKNIGKHKASDNEIFALAFEQERIIITADIDFSYILSQWHHNLPSVLLFRYFPYNPEIQSKAILEIALRFESELLSGSLIIVEPDKIRIRPLPLLS